MLNINDYEGLQDILDNINSKEIRELVIKTLENYSTEEKIKDWNNWNSGGKEHFLQKINFIPIFYV